MSVVAIVPAAGSGTRMNLKTEKQFIQVNGKPLIVHTLQALEDNPRISRIILVVSKARMGSIKEDLLTRYHINKVSDIVEGGSERCFSVRNAVHYLKPDDELVLIHDAVRPFLNDERINASIDAASSHGAAAIASKITDTVKRAEDGMAVETVDRENLWCIETPQVFKKEVLEEAFQKAEKENDFGTDECYIVEKAGRSVKLVPVAGINMKVTLPGDRELAERVMCQTASSVRVGTGYDVHRLVADRKLILGGVEIPHETGLLGHSDADVLCHAIGDALLGAAGLGDLGRHFPDSDEKYKGISSIRLLKEISSLLKKSGFRVVNVDATVVAQRPKLADYIQKMRENIAESLSSGVDQVSVKATTTEKLGFEGREEGISSQSYVSIGSIID